MPNDRYLLGLLILGCGHVWADDFSHAVPMWEEGTATYFVTASVGDQSIDFLVDTGAGYATLNRNIIADLVDAGVAKRSGAIEGVLANGQSIELPIYSITGMDLGGCLVRDVEVAQTPPGARNLLGLSVLRSTAPFSFSLEPAELRLSKCTGSVTPMAGKEASGNMATVDVTGKSGADAAEVK